MGLEVEARFRAEDPSVLDALAAWTTLADATLGEARTVQEEDRYLDTRDRRLAAARWACRLRTRRGRTVLSLKGPPATRTAGWLHRRPEVEGPAHAGLDPLAWPPSEARDRLLALSGGQPLVERLTLLQRRTERLVSVAGRTIGTLSLDSVTVASASGHRSSRSLPFHLVELELHAPAAGEDHLRQLAERLATEPGLVAEPRTKLELALDLDAHRA